MSGLGRRFKGKSPALIDTTNGEKAFISLMKHAFSHTPKTGSVYRRSETNTYDYLAVTKLVSFLTPKRLNFRFKDAGERYKLGILANLIGSELNAWDGVFATLNAELPERLPLQLEALAKAWRRWTGEPLAYVAVIASTPRPHLHILCRITHDHPALPKLRHWIYDHDQRPNLSQPRNYPLGAVGGLLYQIKHVIDGARLIIARGQLRADLESHARRLAAEARHIHQDSFGEHPAPDLLPNAQTAPSGKASARMLPAPTAAPVPAPAPAPAPSACPNTNVQDLDLHLSRNYGKMAQDDLEVIQCQGRRSSTQSKHLRSAACGSASLPSPQRTSQRCSIAAQRRSPRSSGALRGRTASIRRNCCTTSTALTGGIWKNSGSPRRIFKPP
ncbi:hypothetical protein [Azospirillum sp. B506]|uniref:hypothetical protein n=1 Tax=Azospirillum sp. B506 TaxID=137721 RepID=UPI0005B26B8E|nr:hypothetical protein [Azospirillum sp. B506]